MTSEHRSPQSHQLARNTLASYGRFLVAFLVLACLTPWVTRILGDERYGLWVLLLAVGGYLELLDMGLAGATVKHLGGTAQKPLAVRRRIVATLGRAYARVTCLTVVVAIVALAIFLNGYPLPESLRWSATWAGIGIVGRIVVQLPGSFAAGVLAAHERLDWVNGVRAAGWLATAALQVGVLWYGGGLIALAFTQVLVATLESAALWCVTRTRFDEFRWSRAIDGELARELRRFSTWSVLVNVCAVVIARTDPIVVGLSLPLSAVTLYAIPLRIAEQLLLLCKQSINCFTPIFSRLHRENQQQQLTLNYTESLRRSLGLGVSLTIAIAWQAEPLLRCWMGPEFASSAGVLRVLALAVLARVAQEVAGNLLGMTGRLRIVAIGMVVTAMLNLGLSLVGIAWLGSLGVAVATLLATLLAGWGIVVRSAHRELKVSAIELFRRLVPRLALATIVQLLVLAIGDALLSASHLLSVVALIGTSVALFGLTYDARRMWHVIGRSRAVGDMIQHRLGWTRVPCIPPGARRP